MRIDAVILGATFVLILWGMNRRARRMIRSKRGAIFDDCLSLFSEVNVTQDEVNYPVLRARYKGMDVKIEALVDHLAVRKIPALWLLVSLKFPIPYSGTLDYLVRPQNTEFYSPSASLCNTLDIPHDWPQHATLRTNNFDDIPPLDVVGRFVRRMFKDPNCKEMLITPKGVRIVYLVDQALRSHYMVLRQLVFEHDRLDFKLVKQLIDALIRLIDDLSCKFSRVVDEKVENDGHK